MKVINERNQISRDLPKNESKAPNECLESDMSKVKHAVDQFKGQVTVSKDSEKDVKDYLNNKGISFMIDDHLGSSNNNLTFKLKYPKNESKEEEDEPKTQNELQADNSAISMADRYLDELRSAISDSEPSKSKSESWRTKNRG